MTPASIFSPAIPTVVSILIGQPETIPADPDQALSSKPWRTAFYKKPVLGAVAVEPTGIAGDGQADRKNHGGVDKAVCVYSLNHCDHWQKYLERPDFGAGGFGENLAVAGIEEDQVYIGDVWQIGTATFEVSQPRQPCWKLARRWQTKSLTDATVSTGKTGWYLRVLQPGTITAGDQIVVPARETNENETGQFSIAEAHAIFYDKNSDASDKWRQLAEHPKLSAVWRGYLEKRLSLSSLKKMNTD